MLLTFTLSFLIGASQLLFLSEIKFIWLVSISILSCISLYAVRSQFKKISIIILGFCLGLIYVIGFATNAKTRQLSYIPEEAITVVGKVSNLPISKNGKIKFSFDIEEIETDYHQKKILVNWYNTEKIVKAGQVWQFDLKLKPIHGYKNPGSFDYSKWLFRQSFDATATVKTAKLINKQSGDTKSLINNIRADFSEFLEAKFSSKRVQSLIKALTIGDKSQISYEDSQLFQDTGTAHLIAISGLHIGLIAFIGVLFGRLLFFIFTLETYNRFTYEAAFAISFSLIYALLAGFSIPTIRALIMVTTFALAYVLKMSINRWQAWSIALLIVLLIDPFSVLDVGFWFSFGAVAVLMFAFTGRKFSDNKFVAFIKAQFIILIGLMPLMVIIFGKVNFLTPIANLLVLPLASLLLIPLMFLSFFVHLISESVSVFLFSFVEKLAKYLFFILDSLQEYNYLSVPIIGVDYLAISSLVIVTAILLLPRLFRWKYLVLILLFPLFLKKSNHLEDNQFQVNVLDVGQGLSIIIQTKEHILVYDTGAKYDTGFSLASTVIIPYLQNIGVNDVDKLILSHKDNDHAGGKDELIERYRDMQVYDVFGDYNQCDKDLDWKWDGVEFKVLSPFNINPYLGNNSSCVIRVISQNGSLLLTGDIEDPIEYRLTHHLTDEIKSDVMLVPHHGSRTSSSQEFIGLVNPNIAINSSGFANQFNHPHPKIKKQYLDKGIEFFDTQTKGMIELLFVNDGIKVMQYSEINHHFWEVD